jgi:hypothetical protein
MVEYSLVGLTTEHPGGWQDIIDFVNANYDRYQATYVTQDIRMSKQVHYSNSGGPSTAERVYSSREVEETLPRLEEIQHAISGKAASMGWAVLKSLGLPIPGHKDWLKPCSKWSKP